MKALSAITNGKGEFWIDEVEVGEPGPDEVLIEIKAAGVCHTDWDSMKWGAGILGHEGAGVVKSVGSGVNSVKSGDGVILNWAIPCGNCFYCLRNQYICCESTNQHAAPETTIYKGEPIARSFSIGVLSSYTIVKEAAVVKINVDIPFTSACLIGCGVMTGYGSVINYAKVKPGESVVVIGAGGVGLNAVQGAKVAHAGKIIVVDINEDKLATAKSFGATHVIKADKDDKELENATEKVLELTDGRGADYTFECTGVPALSFAPPMRMVRKCGQACLLSHIDHKLEINFALFTKDRVFSRPTYGHCCPQIDFPAVMDLYQKKELKLDELVTKTYSLNDLQVAFDDMFAGKNARGVIVFE